MARGTTRSFGMGMKRMSGSGVRKGNDGRKNVVSRGRRKTVSSQLKTGMVGRSIRGSFLGSGGGAG